MGCDGGSIPKRHELVKTKKAAERADPRIQLIAAWFFCALSKQPLVAPVVACALGRLYNKDAVLEFLLNKGGYGDGDLICNHVTSFKDVVTLNLTPNPAFKSDNAATGTILGNIDERPLVSRFACPISGREMNGKYRFSYIATCGCVISDQALKEVPSSSCLKCNKPYTADDVIPINPTEPEEIAKLQDRMEITKEKRAKEAEEKKKQKKEKKKKTKSGDKMIVGEEIPPLARKSSGSEAESRDSDAGTGKKRKKSKRGDQEESHVSKKIATTASNINMPLPDLNDRSLLPKSMRVQSDAIKSLYKKDGDKEEGNFLVRGTFNRFAASF